MLIKAKRPMWSFSSITRSNNAGNLGFLKSEERVNVALSRARDALVIVGDSEFISDIHRGTNPLGAVLRFIRATPESCGLELMDKL